MVNPQDLSGKVKDKDKVDQNIFPKNISAQTAKRFPSYGLSKFG
jgi:hypothetical protein